MVRGFRILILLNHVISVLIGPYDLISYFPVLTNIMYFRTHVDKVNVNQCDLDSILEIK